MTGSSVGDLKDAEGVLSKRTVIQTLINNITTTLSVSK
jgi:hypothetical protein